MDNYINADYLRQLTDNARKNTPEREDAIIEYLLKKCENYAKQGFYSYTFYITINKWLINDKDLCVFIDGEPAIVNCALLNKMVRKYGLSYSYPAMDLGTKYTEVSLSWASQKTTF